MPSPDSRQTEPSAGPAAAVVTAFVTPLLARQQERLRRRWLLHGIGRSLVLVAGLVLLFFALDRWLRLPLPIRLFHTALVAAVAGFAAVRFLRYPLTRRFGDVDLALWLEQRFPQLQQSLVTAVQLHDATPGALRNQSRAMLDAVLADTRAAIAGLPLDELFDDRPTARVLAAGGLLATCLVVGAIVAPDTSRVFLLRHLGASTDYPRQTHLHIELPPGGPDLQRTDGDGVTELVLPAGSDLHVSVLATGVVPKEVVLDVFARQGAGDEPRSVAMTPRPGDRFRHVFRRLSGSFEFRARGGDDDRGDRLVVVNTVRPAQVAQISSIVRHPPYTGLGETATNSGGAIEGLTGSDVRLTITTTAPVRRATMVFLESGRRLELSPASVQDDSGTALAFQGRFTIDSSDRYQVELLADNGLRNPNPGTYPISALQDFTPVGRWLLPDDDGLALLPGALLCVRLEARDDFGLAAVELGVERAGARVRELALLPAGGERPTSLVATELVEVRDLLSADGVGNDGLVLQVAMRDNKEPLPGTAELPRRIVQVADPAQLAAHIARAFRSLREEVDRAVEVQTDRRSRLDELVERADATAGETAQVLTGVELGQGRVAGHAARIHRGLMRAFDLHLWNRLEPSQHATTVIELYRDHAQRLTEPTAFDPEFYRDVARRRTAGALGAMETTLDPILDMFVLADGIVTADVPEVARALAEAQIARNGAERAPSLERARRGQQRLLDRLQRLQARLEEWNDYQDLVQEVRALRDRQRELQSRTEEARGR